MSTLSKTTQDHEEIREWAEARGGNPAHVKATASKKDIGILRIDFPGYSGEGTLETISWDDFFKKFDEHNLALVYQEKTAAGEQSNFNKLVSADNIEEEHGSQPASHATKAKAAARKPAKSTKSSHTKTKKAHS